MCSSDLKEPTCGFTGDNQECNQYGNTNDITKSWNTSVGFSASTTGNISGIYDMSGGSWEYVMGVMENHIGLLCSGSDEEYNSGFNGPYCNVGQTSSLINGVNFPLEQKYFDKYQYGDFDVNYNRRILGDATGEMGPFGSVKRHINSWYSDDAWFVYDGRPWFKRSGMYLMGSNMGMFAFEHYPGEANASVGFRVVLSI